MLVFPSFFSLRTEIGVLTHLSKADCKTTKKLLNLQKRYKKEQNFLEREITVLQIIPLETRYPVVNNPEKIFSTKSPTFFISKYEEGWNIVRFFKNCLSSKSLKGT